MIIKWSFVLFTVFSCAGMGLLIPAVTGYVMNKSAASRRVLPALAATAFLLGTAAGITGAANVYRLFNILGNIRAPYSLSIASSAALIVVCIGLFVIGKADGRSSKATVLVALSVILSAALCYGLITLYMRPSRPALNTWSMAVAIPAYVAVLATHANAVFQDGQDVNYLKYVALAVVAFCIGGFALNINVSGDRFLSVAMFTESNWMLYYAVMALISAGIPCVLAIIGRISPFRNILGMISYGFVFFGCLMFAILLNLKTV